MEDGGVVPRWGIQLQTTLTIPGPRDNPWTTFEIDKKKCLCGFFSVCV